MRPLVLALACLLVACAPSRRQWRAEELPAHVAQPAAYAVVRLDAPLALEPRDGAPVLWAMAPREIYSGAPPRYGVFRVLGQERDWVALETLGGPREPHCAETIDALEPFRLRVFVPSRALALVTQREVAQPFEDGTRIELARGVPVEPVQRGLFRVHLGSITTVLQLAQVDVGTRYLPSAELPRPETGRVLAGEVLAAAVPVLGQTGRIESSAPIDAPVYSEEPRGGEMLAELRPPCARIVVRVPPHTLGPREGSTTSEAREEPSAAAVRAGARIHWRDGTNAGVVTREVALVDEAESAGARRCFRHALRPAPEGSAADPTSAVELCFDRRDVIDPGAGAATRLDDPS